jgi:hypothetical protein
MVKKWQIFLPFGGSEINSWGQENSLFCQRIQSTVIISDFNSIVFNNH